MRNTIITLLITILVTSCATQKEVVYFQPKDQASDTGKVAITENYTAKIQPSDLIDIRIFSLSQEASAMFNVFPDAQMLQSVNQNSGSTELTAPTGFLINSDGTVTLPLVGKIPLGGLNTKVAADTITKRLDKYLMQPIVSVRILNFKISILGEVNKPSVYTISNERITIPEALSLAGDLTIFGKRKNVLVIREIDGQRQFVRIDLTKRDFFNSPYYYLRPNDIVYVEPSRGKIIASGTVVQVLPLIISSLSLLLLSYYYIHIIK